MQSESPHARTVCGAKTRSGKPCPNPPVTGKKRCRMHGGNARSGSGSGTFKHGRYSKALPQRFLERFEASISDPELVSLRREIALLDARLEELLGRVDTGESGQIWKDLRKTYNEMLRVEARGEKEEVARSRLAVTALIEKGYVDNAAWKDVFDVVERRRVTVQTEAQRQTALDTIMTAEQVMTLFIALVTSIERNVQDPAVRAQIGKEFDALTTHTVH